MATEESKAIRSDLLVIGCGALLLLGSCIVLATLLRGLVTREPVPAIEDEGEAPEARGRETRIPIDGSFSDTTASQSRGTSAVREEWVLFGSYEEGLQDMAFLRFPISLRADAEVTFAAIEFRSANGGGRYAAAEARNRIYLLDAADQGPFATQSYPTYQSLAEIPVSGTHVAWVTGPWEEGETCTTSNIAPLIRTYLRRSDYAPGKQIGLKITGDPRSRPSGYARLFRASSSEGGHPPVLILRTSRPTY